MRRRWSLMWAARFVAKWEGEELRAYQDSGGIWTIGDGHTGPDVHPGQVISHGRAMELLKQDLRTAASAVDRLVTRRLSIRQRIAWISFTFNCGVGALEESTALERFNDSDVKGAAAALTWWDKDAAGNTLLGLQRRRQAEKWLLLHNGRRRRKVPRTPTRAKAHL